MRSKTSFFNPTIFWKTVTRFWPIWGFYLAVWLFALPMLLLSNARGVDAVDVAGDVLRLGQLLGAAGAFSVSVVSAMAVWSFLYNARAAHGTACLPIRREGLYVSTVLGGVLPLVACNMVILLCTALAEIAVGVFSAAALWQWFAMVNLQLLCFYGVATFCAMLTGNIVVLPILYAVLNFFTELLELAVRGLLQGFVYGTAGATDNIGCYGAPFLMLLRKTEVYAETVEDAAGRWQTVAYHFAGWSVLLAYAAVGLALLIAALFLLRQRRMESAGDVVAIRVLKPVFRWVMALGCGLTMGILVYALFFSADSIYYIADGAGLAVTLGMLVGAFIGWFAAEMMMKKSFRVFTSGFRGWAGYGICALVVVALALCIRMDLFGTERWVPRTERVASVELLCTGGTMEYTEPEDVAAVTAMHQSLIDHRNLHIRDVQYSSSCGCQITYTLRSGREVTRRYDLGYDLHDSVASGDSYQLQELINRPAAIAQRKETAIAVTAQTILGGQVRATVPAPQAAALAGYADAEEFLLVEHCGYGRETVAAMSAAERAAEITALLETFSGELDVIYYPGIFSGEVPAAAAVETKTDVAYTRSSVRVMDLDGDGAVGLDEIFVDYGCSFTPAELAELYQSCIVPDMEEGKLGRVWIVTDQTYLESVYDAGISIDLKAPVENETGAVSYRYDSFTTTPTVAAERTARWLADHGLPLYTLAQLQSGAA